MAKAPRKNKRRKTLKLKDLQTKAISVLDFLLAEAYARGEDIHYRLRIPYGAIQPGDGMLANAEMIVDFSIYFDGELHDESNPKSEPIRIGGPFKASH